MKWDELPSIRKRLVFLALDQMKEHAGELSSEEIGSGTRAADAREVIDAAIEKLWEMP